MRLESEFSPCSDVLSCALSELYTYGMTMGSPDLCTKAVRAPVRQRKSASCTDLYSSSAKMPFALEW